MSRQTFWLCLYLFLCVHLDTFASDSRPDAKLKALYVTGGCCHDFKNLALLLTPKISEFASVAWEIKWGPDVLKNPSFGAGFDVVVYSMCFDETDPASIENIVTLVRNGKPMVAIHCAVHSFKVSDEWRKLVGQISRVHDRYQAFSTQKVDRNHAVMTRFPDNWETAGDELYKTVEMGPEAKVLLKAKSPSTGAEHVVCWTNQYGKGRVFGTTLGHDMKTAEQADYQRLLGYGLLWACDKLDDQGRPLRGYEGKRQE